MCREGRWPATATTNAPVTGAPADRRHGYLPQLDGLRALAVLAVLGYHGGVSWLRGGFLGVDGFFVLSGFLITSLLVDERLRSGTIALGAFWARRARRLLPALMVMLLFVCCYAALALPAGTYPSLRGDVLSALFYLANWHFILAGTSYFHQTGLPSPVEHTWSLAIEEQFYVLWPLLVLLVWRLRGTLRALLWLCCAGAVASALEMGVLHAAGASATRLYYGTDTHAQSLLVGAALAVALAMLGERGSTAGDARGAGAWSGPGHWGAPAAGGRRSTRALSVGLDGAGLAALVGFALLCATVGAQDGVLFEGGFLLAALLAAVVILSVVGAPAGVLARVLALPPLRGLGRVSYGVYLWHYPLFLWVDGSRTGLAGWPLLLVRVSLTLGVAIASFVLLEQPVRRGTFLRRRRALVLGPAAVAATTLVVVLATLPVPVPGQVLSNASAVADRGHVKVLVVGDSTALTLAAALSMDAAHYGVDLKSAAILGCGVADGSKVDSAGTVVAVPRPCSTAKAPSGTPATRLVTTPFGVRVRVPDAEGWQAWDAHWVRTFRPDVVVLLAGRWEVMTRTYRGRWTNITRTRFAAYVHRQLTAAVRLLSARGARVILMTAPCYDAGEQPDGAPLPTDDPARVAAYNQLVRAVGRAGRPVTSVFDLATLVCPGGSYHQMLHGVQVRAADGVHFTLDAWHVLGPRIWPFVLSVSRRR